MEMRENIDFDKVLMTMSPEQIIEWEEKARSYKQKTLDRRVIDLEVWRKQANAEINDLINKNGELQEDNIKLKNDNEILKSKVFVLRNDQDGKYNEFKQVCLKRVHKLVGKKGSDKYILFFGGFSKKIYSDISKQLYVSNSGNIKVEDVEGAKVLASKWRPSKKYIRDTYDKYNTQDDNETLCGEKLLAFKNYKEETNGGKNLEF